MGGWPLKRCAKLPEPASLAAYREAKPEGQWDQMRDDPHHGGQQAYQDVKRTLVAGQRCLCAFCEMRIADGMSDAEIAAKSREQRVEHFHPKDDRSRPPNWALHWPNLWAVCLGGSNAPPAGEPFDTRHYLPPLPENLSCDSFKDYQIQVGDFPTAPRAGFLLPTRCQRSRCCSSSHRMDGRSRTRRTVPARRSLTTSTPIPSPSSAEPSST